MQEREPPAAMPAPLWFSMVATLQDPERRFADKAQDDVFADP